MYPIANCSLEKYMALNMREEAGDICGPCRVYAQPMLMRKSDQYVQRET